ncbi:hypothetical protein H5410_035278 [Solanum commersonii]|uniref:Uncharacterized protein n=1 Tax=Solanum commersonii TaxID=4109 RepID=A0A9J5Y4M9_SOLCO|nr:hypothetical protein H5410_035278 [Solanum commersonii]
MVHNMATCEKYYYLVNSHKHGTKIEHRPNRTNDNLDLQSSNYGNRHSEKALTRNECQIKAVMYLGEIQRYANKLKARSIPTCLYCRVKVSPTS